MNTEGLKVVKDDAVITDFYGVNHKAWQHADGTLVSHDNTKPMLLIKDRLGVIEISHEEAVRYGYEREVPPDE